MGKSSQRSAISLEAEGKRTNTLRPGRATLPRSRFRMIDADLHAGSAGASPSRQVLSPSDARPTNAQVADFSAASTCGSLCISLLRPQPGRAKSGTNATKKMGPLRSPQYRRRKWAVGSRRWAVRRTERGVGAPAVRKCLISHPSSLIPRPFPASNCLLPTAHRPLKSHTTPRRRSAARTGRRTRTGCSCR